MAPGTLEEGEVPRGVELVHASPGRTRLRLLWLRKAPQEARPLAEALERLPGLEEVEVRPYTGSVLCLHDPLELPVEKLLEEARRATGATWVVRPGEQRPEQEEAALLEALREGSGLAREAALFFKGLNLEVLRATSGHMDLAMLTSLGFMVMGAAEVAATRKLPLPPWFNLAWWAFRTFTTLEKRAMRGASPPLRGAEPSPPAGPLEPD